MAAQELHDEKRIMEHMPYLVELMHAIRDVNQALIQGGDAIDAAENLLSDLPEEWEEEIKTEIDTARDRYLKELKINEKYFMTGGLGSQKRNAWVQNKYQSNQYARTIKRKVVTLLKKKDLLFLTKRQIETGSLSLVALDEVSQPDE
jgi:hypothetical protein